MNPLDAATLPAQVIRHEARQRSPALVAIKRCIQSAFGLWVLPRLIAYCVGRGLLGRRAFMAASESIARKSGIWGVYLRQAFYRRTLAYCGQDVYFGWLSVFSMPEARVGERAYIGRFCSIGFADIGDMVMLADHVQILSGGHEHTTGHPGDPIHAQAQQYRQVRIGRGAWIGAGAVIMADVGEGTIVGAGAVVTKSIPAHSIAVGVPARVVQSL